MLSPPSFSLSLSFVFPTRRSLHLQTDLSPTSEQEKKTRKKNSFFKKKARDGAKRIAVAANALARGADVKVQAYPKAEPVMALLAAAVARSPLFAPLSSPERATLLHSMTPVTCSAGQVVIREGDAVADKFFVLEKGAAVATVLVRDGGGDDKENGKSGGGVGGENGDKGEERPKKEKQVREYGPGASFGELALLYSSPRAATVTATAN